MFKWKENINKFKGEGIYHLTLAVVNRTPLLGKLCPSPSPSQIAQVIPTELGAFVRKSVEAIPTYYPDIQVITKCLMPDHIHILLWAHEHEEASIKMVIRGFAQGCSKEARRLHQRSLHPHPDTSISTPPSVSILAQFNCADKNTTPPDYSCGNGANTLFSPPYIRTLSHAHQLDHMYQYIKQNPLRAWIKHTHPDLFKLHRDTQAAGLTFSSLGNHWLLEWPVRQSVICSRSISDEDLQAQERLTLYHASHGAITYSAAISKGEQHIVRKVREAGYPLVIVLKDGFPKTGTENERYFKPGGIYFELCAQGKLLLLEATESAYSAPSVITATEDMLYQKSLSRRHPYTPIPHTSQRWRFIAQNVMIRMMTEE